MTSAQGRSPSLMLFHSALLTVCSLYVISLMTSMAGMEIFSWTLFGLGVFGLSLVSAFRNHKNAFYVPLALMLWSFLSAVLNGLPSDVIVWGLGDYRWIMLLLAFVAVADYILDKKDMHSSIMKKALPLFLLVLSVVGIYAIVQHFTGYDMVRGLDKKMVPAVIDNGTEVRWRSSGFFSMPLTYAYSIGMVVSFILPFAILGFKKRVPWLLMLALALPLTSIITSFTRGAWLALAVSAGVILALMVSTKRFILIGPILIVTAFTLLSFNSGLTERMTSIADQKNRSNFERVVIWKSFWMMFKEHPVMGVGYNVDGIKLQKYLDRLGEDVEFPGHAHNNYLQFLGVTGLVGLLLYLIVSGQFLFMSYQLYSFADKESWIRALGAGLFSSQIFFHVGGLTECNFFDAEVRHVLIFVWALTIAFKSKALTGDLKNYQLGYHL